ncbi:bifunctional folylpolyglutamate synthase/dihydrofolate synthase [Spirochaeta africana]|uniref:Dihydrofolate synthase/folylpolyglutamate synthase n=1 Tax=Spirochaeta africana (strain ATCC 700263 / DSM 8902 / Z-7692) TaxID=889378 RepID=H9UIZ1_SPIAZ|nr:Mur ligase family protein [Spirochaeta africana]AFG37484.1 folylpolyglutamate synthase/dihydrofolate synthase [Spirochaeta africana DSM 8902]
MIESPVSSRLHSLDEGFAWIESLTNFERKPMDQREYRLDRMQTILELLEHPERKLQIVHLAGSKGKGSTAAMIAAILHTAGMRTAVYTSPHVLDYRERFQLLGDGFPDELLLEGIRILCRETTCPGGQLAPLQPTTFELLTALFFYVAAAADVTYAVLETGIGGRLDATNAVADTRAAVITSIELEHTDILGDSIEKIASEKAGIIKPGRPVFIGQLPPAAVAVATRRAAELAAPLAHARDLARACPEHGEIEFADGSRIRPVLQMLGSVQLENAALAAAVIRSLHPEIPTSIIRKGLEAAVLPARMQLIAGVPPIVIDGAHTVDSVARNLPAAASVMPAGGTVIFGAVRGKNIAGMVRELCQVYQHAVVCRPGSFKPSDPEFIAAEFRRHLPADAVAVIEDPAAALTQAAAWCTQPDQGICVTGSFFLAGKILHAIAEGTVAARAV